MKKVLYGTTALVSAGVVAAAPAQASEKIKLSLGGYYNAYFMVGETNRNDPAQNDYLNTNVFSEGEVTPKGKTVLDNGLEVGFQAQFEVNNGSTDNTPSDTVDEAFLYIEGGFGRFLIGSENSAAYLMQTSSPEVGAPLSSGWVTVFIPAPSGAQASFRHPAVSTNGDFGNDDNKLTYFTPRISGFQLGVSYAPDVQGTGGENNGLQVEDGSREGEDGISLGVNYKNTFGETSFLISGGYKTQTLTGTTNDDWNQYSAGVRVGFGAFTIGGSYLNEDSDTSTDGTSYSVGVTYGTGPWTIGGTVFLSESEGSLADTDEDELTAAKIAVAYKLGAGVTASATLMYADWEVEASDVPANGDDSQDGFAGIVGITVGF